MFCFISILFGCLSEPATSIDLHSREDESHSSQRMIHTVEIQRSGELNPHSEMKHNLVRRAKSDSHRVVSLGADAHAARVEDSDLLEDENAHEEAEVQHTRSLMSERGKRGPYVRKKWCQPGYNDDLYCQKKTTTTTTTTVVHCVWAEWNEWNECTRSCGEGEKFRVRNPAVRASPGGRQCNGNARQTDPCNVQACPQATTTVAPVSEPKKDGEKQQEGAQEGEKKGGSMTLYILIGGVVLLIVGGAGAFFMMGDGLNPKRNQMMDVNDMSMPYGEEDDYGAEDYDGAY